jgi:beta-lactamase class A
MNFIGGRWFEVLNVSKCRGFVVVLIPSEYLNWMLNDERRYIFFICFCLLFASCRPETARLRDTILKELTKQPGTFAVAFWDLSNGEQILIREHEVFHAASTMKTPVMIEVFKQCAEGKFSLSDSIIVKNEFTSIVDGSIYSLDPSGDSEQDLYNRIGGKEVLSALVYKMIIASSNLATNIVIDLVDAKAVTRTMHELGAKDIQVLRGVEDSRAFEKGLNNTVTAYDLMLIYEKLATGEIVDQQASQAMIDILLDQQFNAIIPARLPAGVRVAHKTGNITGVLHDSGIVFLPDGRKYVLVLLSRNLKDTEGAKAAMAGISELLYQHVIGQD